MKNEQHYYAVTRIHNFERDFLNAQAIEAMGRADALSGCLSVLREHGWTAEENMPERQVIEARQARIWSFLEELPGISDILSVFRHEHDFNNLKAIIKLRYAQKTQQEGEGCFSAFGALPIQTLIDCAAQGSFEPLPEMFSIPAGEASRVLLQTGNAQLADAVLDNACLEALNAHALEHGSDVLKQYAKARADAANISIAVRGITMDKSEDFFKLAMTELGALPKAELCEAAAHGVEALYEYIASTKYEHCLDSLKKSPSRFLAQAESGLIEEISPQRHAIGGADAVYAFMIAAQNEIKAVRLLLSAKRNNFTAEFVSGCLRRMYV